MKRFFVAVVITFIVAWFGWDSKQSAYAEKQKTGAKSSGEAVQPVSAPGGKYDIKSGIIYFDVKTPNGTHKEIVFFDDYGRKECVERYGADSTLVERRFADGRKLYAQSNKDPGTFYVLNENTNNGTEMRFEKDTWSDRRKNKYKYRDEPQMAVAGKTCEAYCFETKAGKTLFAGWSHITLYHKQETRFGEIVRKATRIEQDVPVPADKFTLPAGAKIEKAP
jgi:hypothetical protein